MRTFIVSMIVLLILLVGIVIYSNYLKGAMDSIEEYILDVSDTAYKKEWEKCKEKVKILEDVWKRNEPVLSMFNDHEDVDKITLSISELKESVLFENFEHTFKSLAETKKLLERIRKNETLSLENILGLAHFEKLCHIML